jgi:hypothetical protein
MAKNLSREFATMSDDERRRFALEEEEGTDDQPAELTMDEPRNEDRMGRHYAGLGEEGSDSEERDSSGGSLDADGQDNETT